MVDELDASNELRAQALNIIGTSRTKLGDREGLKDLELCIEITQPGSHERLRGYINLALDARASSASSRAASRCMTKV